MGEVNIVERVGYNPRETVTIVYSSLRRKKATHIAAIFLGVKVKRAHLVSKLIFLVGGLKSLSILCHKKKKLATWEPIKFNNNVPI